MYHNQQEWKGEYDLINYTSATMTKKQIVTCIFIMTIIVISIITFAGNDTKDIQVVMPKNRNIVQYNDRIIPGHSNGYDGKTLQKRIVERKENGKYEKPQRQLPDTE